MLTSQLFRQKRGRSRLSLADGIEQLDQLLLVLLAEHTEARLIELVYRFVQRFDDAEPFRGDGAQHLPAVVRTTLAGHQAFFLQPIQQTGDAGRLDASGRLYVEGRLDEMFISGGENIHPGRIERVLGAVAGVTDVVVVPAPDAEFGERPVAFVGGSWTESALRRAAERELPRFMHPVAYRPLPETRAGIKPRRSELRHLAAT